MTNATLPSKHEMYRAVSNRDSEYDGVFITAVRTTGIFCRPSCSAKTPKENNVEFCIVKNTLAKIALKKTELSGLEPFFKGPTALAISNDDDVAPGKVIADFAKKTKVPSIKASVINGEVFSVEETSEIIKLPSRDVLLGQLANVLQSPITKLVWGLNGMIQNLVGVLDQISKQKEESSS